MVKVVAKLAKIISGQHQATSGIRQQWRRQPHQAAGMNAGGELANNAKGVALSRASRRASRAPRRKHNAALLPAICWLRKISRIFRIAVLRVVVRA